MALAAISLVVAACSTPLTDAERAAGAAYAKAAETADRRVLENDAQLDATSGGPQDYRDFYKRWAEIEHEFVAAVSPIPVPASLTGDLQAVAAAYGHVEALLRRFETVPFESWDPPRHELDHAIDAAEKAANVFRARVGLPTAKEPQPS